jgi:8-oxo-dGTP diphosphatase
VPVLRSTALIDAAPRTVAGLLREVRLSEQALHRLGHRVEADVALLAPGDRLRVGVALLPGVRLAVTLEVDAVSEAGLRLTLGTGPLPELVRSFTITSTAAGTLVLDELRWTAPGGWLGRLADVVIGRRLVLRVQAATLDALARRATALAADPVVVATALHRDGRVLIGQRARPPALAGRWELPGGRVEPGESEVDAVRRECAEELAVPVTVTGRIGTDLPIGTAVLRVHTATLAPGAPEPRAVEHTRLRWVPATELDGVDWVDADRAVVADLVALLGEPSRAQPRA